MEKKTKVFSAIVNNECGITIDHDFIGARNIYMLLYRRRNELRHFVPPV
jgi:hypothetical protein